MIDPCSECIVHFIFDVLAVLHEEPAVVRRLAHLDIREISLDNSIHNTPNMSYWVFVLDPYLQLLTDKRSRSFSTKQVLGSHGFSRSAINVLQFDLDGVVGIRLLINVEALDGPRSLYLRSVLLEVGNEDALYETLVQESSKRVSRINEAGTASPCACPGDAFAILRRVPEGHFEDPCRLVCHDGGLESHVPEQVQRTRLDAIGATCWRWLCPIVDVFNLVAPSCQAG